MTTQVLENTAASPSWLKRLVRRHQLASFVVLAFALSWWPWPLTLLNPASAPMVPFGPTIAALVVTALSAGMTGTRTLLGQFARWRVGFVWYALALGLPIVLFVVAASLNVLRGAPMPRRVIDIQWSTFVLMFFSVLLVGGAMFEELGWRGFALARLQVRHSALAASVLLGGIWGVWHLPLLLSDPTHQRPPAPFLVWIVGLSVLHTWIYLSTRRSIVLVMLFHAAINTGASVFLPLFAGTDYLRMWWLMALTTLIAAIVVCAFTGRRLVVDERMTAAETMA